MNLLLKSSLENNAILCVKAKRVKRKKKFKKNNKQVKNIIN